MAWRLMVQSRAEKDLAALPRRDREAVNAVLGSLTADPGAVDLKELACSADRWRVRVGQWRVIVRLDNRAGVITVLRVLPRGRAYRD